MTAEEICEVLDKYGVSVPHFANMIGMHRDTIHNYIEDGSKTRRKNAERIEAGLSALMVYDTKAPKWDKHNSSCQGNWYNILRREYLEQVAAYDKGFQTYLKKQLESR